MVVYNQEWVFEKCSPVELVRKINNFVIAQAPSDLQPHYGNGVFDNVHLLPLDNTKR